VDESMKKEPYFTKENREEKIAEWKGILSDYYSKKRKFTFNPDNSGLFIIDMQKYFLDPSSHAFLPAAKTIIEPITKLNDAFKKKNKPVFLTQYGIESTDNYDHIMQRWWGDVLATKDPFFALIPELETECNTYTIDNYDKLSKTDILSTIQELDLERLVITGVATHLCCETTARIAFSLGFEVYLPIDCLGTYTEELHLNSMKAASHGFGIPITSKEILEAFK
jgi:nicotinamidase-related amidase